MLRLLFFTGCIVTASVAVASMIKNGRVKVALVVLLVGMAGVFSAAIIVRNRNDTEPASLARKVRTLLTEVGGTKEVYKEADQIFERFGVDRLYWFNPSDLKQFPALSALGDVDFISPKDQRSTAYIQVRIHPPNDHYLIYILDSNTASSNTPPSAVRVDSRICASR